MTDALLASSNSLSEKIVSAFEASRFLYSKFRGEPDHAPPPVSNMDPPQKFWRNVYGVVKFRSLTLYSSNNQDEVVQSLNLPNLKVTLDKTDSDHFYRFRPIILSHSRTQQRLYLYAPSSLDKEDWYYKLQRATQLPIFADHPALSAFYRDLAPVKAYDSGLQKLLSTLESESDNPSSPTWLNALLGRAFLGIHSNPKIKEWIMETISRRMAHVHRTSTSFLGDIVVKDLDVGNSLPILSNPHLLSLSEQGDMSIELDLDYTGGISVEAATAASISVSAWTEYMKPIAVPLIVRVSITHFSARMLLKLKPLWESNRIWFGFYKQPEVKLELKVEPIISNKLVKLELVNQVIERRIKEALEEFVILPKMDDFVFWPFKEWSADGSTDGFEDDEKESEDQDYASDEVESDLETPKDIYNTFTTTEPVHETNLLRSKYSTESLNVIESNTSEPDLSEWTHSLVQEQNNLEKHWEDHITKDYLDHVGDAAYKLGQWVRYYHIDSTTSSILESLSNQVQSIAGPALGFIDESTRPVRQQVLNETVKVGLELVDRLGLKPDPPEPLPASSNIPKMEVPMEEHNMLLDTENLSGSSRFAQRTSSSRVLEMMGVSISTFAPSELDGSPSLRRKRRMLRKAISTSNLSTAEQAEDSQEL